MGRITRERSGTAHVFYYIQRKLLFIPHGGIAGGRMSIGVIAKGRVAGRRVAGSGIGGCRLVDIGDKGGGVGSGFQFHNFFAGFMVCLFCLLDALFNRIRLSSEFIDILLSFCF